MTSISDNFYSISKEHWEALPAQYMTNCVYLARSSKFLGKQVTYEKIDSPNNDDLIHTDIIMTNLVEEDLTFLKLSGIDIYLESFPTFLLAIRETIKYGNFTSVRR